MSRKYLKTIFLLSLIFIGFFYGNNFLIKKQIVINLQKDKRRIKYKIPFLKQKIHVNIYTDTTQCQDFANKIKIYLYKNSQYVDIKNINQLSYNDIASLILILPRHEKINIVHYKKCKIILEIVDPYGNMDKMLLLIVLPTLILLFEAFKIIWIYINSLLFKL